MVICADNSFLFSLYGNDIKSAEAVPWIVTITSVIWISSLNHFELLNALRFSECRRFIGSGHAAQFISDFLTEASHLSHAHTLTGGHLSFEILHVAAAKIIGATHFLTFDANQRKLAESEGLEVPL